MKSEEVFEVRELSDGDSIFFTPVTEDLGKAEFHICPVYRYGYLRELWIIPKQQHVENIRYRLKVPKGIRSVDVGSWTHKGMENPWIWQSFWCREHKTICQSCYVPRNAVRLTVGIYSCGVELRFGCENRRGED